MTKTAKPPKGTKKSEKPAPKTEAKPAPKGRDGGGSSSGAKQAPSTSSPKPIQPAPKVVFKIDAAGAEKLERLPSLLGTIHARKQAAMANRDAAFEDRDAIEKELIELGLEAREARTDEYLRKCADKTEVLDKIKTLDIAIKACNNAYDRVAGECQQGTFKFAEVTVDELLAEASKKGGGQMTLGDLQPDGTLPGPGSSWKKIHAARPDLFGGREWPLVHSHTMKIEDLKAGSIGCDNPLVLANYLVQKFNEPGLETKDRESVLPAAPEWFRDSLREVMAAAASAELGDADNEEHQTDAESILRALTKCADADPDAWIAIAGGTDGSMNKAILAAVE